MDDVDRQLIALLRQDARTTVATLATKLGVSRGTVTNRVKKLEDDGVITGYTVRLRPDSEPQRIRAWMDNNPRPPKVNPPEVEAALQSAYAAIDTFAKAFDEIRQAVAASSGRSSTRAGQ